MNPLRTLALLTLLAAPMTGCFFPEMDDDPLLTEEERSDHEFDAECAVIGGPAVYPSDLSRIDAAIGDAKCARLDGNLTIRGDVTTLGKIEYLDDFRVSGRVVISNTYGWEDLKRLKGLTEVDGDLVVEECEGLKSTDGLHRLRLVEGDFRISQNPDLRVVEGADRLRRIGADLIIEENPVLCDVLGFDGLQYIAEYDSPDERPDPAGGFGGFDPEFRPGVVDPHIIMTDNPQLKRIEGFGALTDIDGDIRLERNDELVTIKGFHQLEFMTGRLVLRDQPFLQDIDDLVRVSCLREVVLENTAMTDLSAFDEVWEIGHLELVNNDGLAGVGGFQEDLRLRGPVLIRDNASLRTLAGFARIESLDFDRDSDRRTPAIYLDTPNARCVDVGLRDGDSDLTIEGNPVLEELGMPALARISGSLTVRGNDQLPDLSGIANLGRVFGDITIDQNASMVRIDGLLPLERMAPGDIIISGNPELAVLDGFRDINDIDGNLTISGNAKLGNVTAFRFLKEVDALVIRENGVTDLGGLAALDETDSVEIASNPALTNLDDLVALETIWSDLRITDNPVLSVVSLPALRAADGVVVQNNPLLPQCQIDSILEQIWDPSYTLMEGNGGCS